MQSSESQALQTAGETAGESQASQIAGEPQAALQIPGEPQASQIAGELQIAGESLANLVLSQIGIAMRLVSYSHHAMWVLPETLRHMPQVVEVYDESLLMSQLPGLISQSSSSADEWP